MGVWNVSDAENPDQGRPVIVISNTSNGLISISISDGGHAFVTPTTAERIRTHISAAISVARGDRPSP